MAPLTSSDAVKRASSPSKPLLRGVSHQVSFFVALIAGTVLTAATPMASLRWAVAVYGITLATLFGVSALYHRPSWGPKARQWMRRFDHASIFLLIAGTGTPLGAAMPQPEGSSFLLVLWGGALLGVLRAIFWISAPKPVVVLLALGLGWVAWVFRSLLQAALSPQMLVLFFVGGVIYSVGALVYAFKKPDPWPRVFGYHEVFHALVIIAAGLQFSSIATAVF